MGTLPLPPQFNVIPPGRMCRVAGWGRTQVNEPGSDTLREVKQRLMNPQACRHYRTFDHNFQLCVGNPRKTKSAFEVILGRGFFSTSHCSGSRRLVKGHGVGRLSASDRVSDHGPKELESPLCRSVPCSSPTHGPMQSLGTPPRLLHRAHEVARRKQKRGITPRCITP